MEKQIQFALPFSFSWGNWKTNCLKISRLSLQLFSDGLHIAQCSCGHQESAVKKTTDAY